MFSNFSPRFIQLGSQVKYCHFNQDDDWTWLQSVPVALQLRYVSVMV